METRNAGRDPASTASWASLIGARSLPPGAGERKARQRQIGAGDVGLAAGGRRSGVLRFLWDAAPQQRRDFGFTAAAIAPGAAVSRSAAAVSILCRRRQRLI